MDLEWRKEYPKSVVEGEFFIFHVLKAPHCERRNMDFISTSVGNTGLSQFCSNRPLISWRKISRRGVRRGAVNLLFISAQRSNPESQNGSRTSDVMRIASN